MKSPKQWRDPRFWLAVVGLYFLVITRGWIVGLIFAVVAGLILAIYDEVGKK